MFLFRPYFRKTCFLPGALMALGMVSACSLTDILTGVDTNYAIEGESDDLETKTYLQNILDERLREKTKDLAEDGDIRARQEDYAEQTIRADLLKALRAKGYYNARVRYRDGKEPFTGIYELRYGPQFSIASIDVLPEAYKAYLPEDGVSAGQSLDAVQVLEAQAGLQDALQTGHCYYSLDVGNEVVLDRENAAGDVDFIVEAGAEGTFGPLRFTGNDSVKESYLRKLVPWKEGKCFRHEKIEAYKATLLQSGLFAKADAVLPEAPQENGSVPVTMDLRERAHRSVSAGLTYYSDEGPGGVLGWEHRNLFGAAEKLSAELGISSLKQSFDLDFTKPYFIRNDQTLGLTASLRRQDTDAFEEFGIESGISLRRDFTSELSGTTGVSLSLTEITDSNTGDKDTFGLVSLPQTLAYDTRDDTLDPHKGWNLTAEAEPFFDVLGQSDPFFKTEFTGRGYLHLTDSPDLVLASRIGIGSIWGAATENVPATERFYAGGGGSVRGYGYQEVGPKENGDPAGGRSLVEASVEMRTKFTEKFGGVAFVDAGHVSDESAPKFDKMAIGAGIGVRYYTGFGPLRFDIAVPLTEKDDLDRNYQFYISIGQAF